jgi:hypothetical protein
MKAAEKNHMEVVDLLVKAGAVVDSRVRKDNPFGDRGSNCSGVVQGCVWDWADVYASLKFFYNVFVGRERHSFAFSGGEWD